MRNMVVGLRRGVCAVGGFGLCVFWFGCCTLLGLRVAAVGCFLVLSCGFSVCLCLAYGWASGFFGR